MDYVNREAAEVARDWEKRFQGTRKMAGIIFVSVDPTPAPTGISGEYTITLGLDRTKPFDDSTAQGIILKVLEREVESGLYKIRANVFRGVSGACYEGDAGPGEASA